MDARRNNRVLRGVVTVAAIAMVAACSDAKGVDKAGSDTTVLTLATIDEVNNNGQSYGPQAFVDSLVKVSGGRLKVAVRNGYGDGAPDAESNLIKAIAAGDLDGGWPSTRAFAAAGIAGLGAFEAPMTITSYSAQKQLVTGPIASAAVKRLEGTGIVGLGLAVGPLRRPFAAKKPLLGPADWAGMRFRTFNSPVQEAAVKALGATPVNLGFGWVDEAHSGKLRGAEFDVAQYAKNGETTVAGNVTANVVLWPKVFVLSLSQRRYDRLSEQQRGWVREAAAQATKASVDARYDESGLATELCGKGVRFVQAAPDEIAALRTRLRPVLSGLAADPKEGALLKDIQALAAANPQPEILNVPVDCASTGPADTKVGPVPETRSSLPDGAYRVELTKSELEAAGLSPDEAGLAGTWTLTVADGTYQLSCRPLAEPGVDCGHETYEGPLDVGDLRGTSNTVYFVYRPDRLARLTGCQLPMSSTLPNHCAYGETYRMIWSLNGADLSFSHYGGGWANPHFLVKPWRKIS